MITAHSRAELRGRSLAERAFDRCIAPFAIYFAVSIMVLFVSMLTTDGEMPRFDSANTAVRVPFGCLLLCHWFWAARSVAGAWNDPAGRVLRFSSVGLLAIYALSIYGVLRTPAH